MKMENNNRNQSPLLVELVYQENLYTPSEISSVQRELRNVGIDFHIYETRNFYNASIDYLVAQIEIILSSEITQAILLGIVSSAIYDVLKQGIKRLWAFSKKGNFARVTSSLIKKDEPQIHLQVDNQVFVFPKDVDTEVANHYIDKIFESLQEKNRPQRIYVIYNKKRNKLEEYTEEELIQREIRKHAKKSH